VGSTNYISRSKANLKKIIGVINLETCGYTSKAKNSQKFPTGMNPEYFPQNDVKDATIGDYIVIVVDKNSEKLRQIFFEQTKEKIPSLLIGMPMNYEEIKKTARDLLRSDHAPFWKMNVPALMITDTANFRNPYYHTPGDTIGTLDFEFMAKLTEVVVNTIKVYKD
jgi:Zn-dependent M28 family amino/carboxypeptidase